MKLYFSDFFGVQPSTLKKYGAFNISLVSDLPLFVDPFLLFNSRKPKYRLLHDRMIEYLRFLKQKSEQGDLDLRLLGAWYTFSEIKQNWLGFERRQDGRGRSAAVQDPPGDSLSAPGPVGINQENQPCQIARKNLRQLLCKVTE